MVLEQVRPAVRVFACALAVFASTPHAAQAQDAEATRRSMRVTRVAYERDLEALRAEVLRVIDQQLAEAEASPDTATARDARASHDGFTTRGELPQNARRTRWTTQHTDATTALMRAYQRTIQAYENVGDAEAATTTADDLELFRVVWDLAPWGEDLGVPETSILSPGSSMTIQTALPEAYRLEVQARRSGDGRLIVSTPMPEGGLLEATSDTDDRGEMRVLLTVVDKRASADLGVTGPLTTRDPDATAQGLLTLRAEDGPIEIISVRTKPVTLVEARALPEAPQAREPREPRERTQPRQADRPAPTPMIDRLAVNSTWRGELRRVGQPTITVVLKVSRKTETHVYMNADLPGAGGLEYAFRASGQTLALESVRPTGQRSGNYHDANGVARIRDDQFHFQYRFKFTQGNQRNQTAEGEMFLRRD